jgi:hypothetical protein
MEFDEGGTGLAEGQYLTAEEKAAILRGFEEDDDEVSGPVLWVVESAVCASVVAHTSSRTDLRGQRPFPVACVWNNVGSAC